jgi:DNA-binding NtrC family response regulator
MKAGGAMKKTTITNPTILTFPVGTPEPEVIRKLTVTTLEFCGRNKTKTARALGISRRTLYRRLAEWSQSQVPDPISARNS